MDEINYNIGAQGDWSNRVGEVPAHRGPVRDAETLGVHLVVVAASVDLLVSADGVHPRQPCGHRGLHAEP
eukprot:1284315-Alexandrium_andersonii.AAC.1